MSERMATMANIMCRMSGSEPGPTFKETDWQKQMDDMMHDYQ